MATEHTSTTYAAGIQGSEHHEISEADKTPVEIKGSAASVVMVKLDNTMNDTDAAHVKLYDTAGTPTVGTDIPRVILRAAPGAARKVVEPQGAAFANKVWAAVTKSGGHGATDDPGSAPTVEVVLG